MEGEDRGGKKITEKETSPRKCKEDFLTEFYEARTGAPQLWILPGLEVLQTKVDVANCPCICNYYNYYESLCQDPAPPLFNDYVDAQRVSVAPYVDIFTCDKRVKDRLRKAKYQGQACSTPEEVMDLLRRWGMS